MSENDRLAEEPIAAPPVSAAPPLPFGVKLAAALLISVGMSGAADIVLAILGKGDEGGALNLIFLFIGFGLLRRSQTSLGCATTLFGMLALVLVATGIALAIPACRSNLEWESGSNGNAVLSFAAFVALAVIVFYLLRDPSAKAAFGVKPPESDLAEAKSWGWILVIVVAIGLTNSIYNQSVLEKTIEGAFLIDTTIEAGDAEKGGVLTGVSLVSRFSSSEKSRPEVTISPKSETSLHVSGISFFPVPYELRAEGYEPLEFEITKGSPRDLYLKLQPIKEAEKQD